MWLRRCWTIDGKSGSVRVLLRPGSRWNRKRSREGRLGRYENGLWRLSRSDLGQVDRRLARWRGRNASRLRSGRPRWAGHGRLRWHNRPAGWTRLKINNGAPAGRGRCRRICLLLFEVPIQRLSPRGTTRPGRIGKTCTIAVCCLCLGCDHIWFECSSSTRRTDHPVVSAISLSEAQRPLGDI
jgi:hypothetical protein